MRTLYKILVVTGLAVAGTYTALTATALYFDGRVFDLPDHKLIVLEGGFHLYPKVITYEFLEEVE